MTQVEIECLKRALQTIEDNEIAAFDRLNDPLPPISEKFKRRMQKLCRIQQRQSWSFPKVSRRRVMAVVFAIIIMAALTVSVSAAGDKIFSFIVTFSREAVGLEVVSPDSLDSISEHYTLDEIPENYVFAEDTRYQNSHITRWVCDEKYISFRQETTEYTSIHVSLKEGEYQYTTLRGVEMLYVNSHNTYTFIWQEDGYSFTFLCPDDIPWGDIVRMIESIRPEA